MGLLDTLLKGVTTAAQGSQGGKGGGAVLLEAASQLIRQQPGGLQGLVNQLAQGGLGREAQSWVGTGDNLPVSAAQIAKALSGPGGVQLGEIVNRLGLSQNDALGGLAKILPELVNQLTPSGQIGAGGSLEQDLGAVLKKVL